MKIRLIGAILAVVLAVVGTVVLTGYVNNADARAAGEDVALPEGMQSVSIALPVERVVGGTIKPGDTVGVVIFATITGADGAEVTSMSRRVFHKVLVTAVRKGTSTPPATGEDAAAEASETVMVTLARPTADIQ